jgi:hypothetical protein
MKENCYAKTKTVNVGAEISLRGEGGLARFYLNVSA